MQRDDADILNVARCMLRRPPVPRIECCAALPGMGTGRAGRCAALRYLASPFHENVGCGKLELPENEMHTTSFWLTLGHSLLAGLPSQRTCAGGALAQRLEHDRAVHHPTILSRSRPATGRAEVQTCSDRESKLRSPCPAARTHHRILNWASMGNGAIDLLAEKRNHEAVCSCSFEHRFRPATRRERSCADWSSLLLHRHDAARVRSIVYPGRPIGKSDLLYERLGIRIQKVQCQATLPNRVAVCTSR